MSLDVVLASTRLDSEGSPDWAYLGKHGSGFYTAVAVLGAERRVLLGGHLDKVARRTKQDFVLWIDHVGRSQTDAVSWWATRLASASPLQTDAHLLFSFAIVFEELADVYAHAVRRYLIVVEDPWLYEMLRLRHDRRPGISFRTSAHWPIFLFCLRKTFRGVAARLRFLGDLLWQTYLAKRNGPNFLAGNAGHNGVRTVWIYSPAEPALFAKRGCLENPYMPGLARLLGERSISVRHVVGLMVPKEIRQQIFCSSAPAALLLNYLRFSSLWRAIMVFWIPHVEKSNLLAGLDLRLLLSREMWEEIGSANLCLNRLYYELFRMFFGLESGDSLFYFFEGQPWEKMLCLARRDAASHMFLVGHQHSTVPALLLNYFPHPAAWEHMPQPDRIAVNGSMSHSFLAAAGYPEQILIEAGALRYRSAVPSIRYFTFPLAEQGRRYVFVGLPSNRFVAREMMDLLISHEKLWVKYGINFLIKKHPDLDYAVIGRHPSECPRLTETSEAFDQQSVPLTCVVYASSTLGLEALLNGIPTLSYLSDTSINLDPSVDYFPSLVCTCDRVSFSDKLLKLLQSPPAWKPPNFQNVFGPVQKDRWVELALAGRQAAVA